MRIPTLLFFLSIFGLVALITPVYAYIDPASGSMILQAIALAFVVGWFAVKNFWGRIIAFLKIRPKDDANTECSKKSDGTH